jgi:inorganic pyrophosphatase
MINKLLLQRQFRRNIRTLTSIGSYAVGELGTESYKLFFTDRDKNIISPWHDINLRAKDGLFNFINEIPKYTRAKMELATKVKHNPIAQDIKSDKLRYYHGPIYWNYGCFPQTWEDPSVKHPDLVRNDVKM